MDLNIKDNSLRIGSNGVVSTPNQSFVQAYRDTTQLINNSGFVDVVYSTEVVDLLNEYDHSTGIFTARNDGIYICVWGVLSESTSWIVKKLLSTALSRNNLVSDDDCWFGVRSEMQAANPGQYNSSIGCATVPLSSGENLRIKVAQNSSAYLNLIAEGQYNYLSILRIG